MENIIDKNYTQRYQDQKYISKRYQTAGRLVNLFKKLEIFKSNRKILDAGCGSGELGEILIKECNLMAYGTDINNVAIKKSKQRGLITKKSDITKKWPFTDGFFDYVINTQTIEHIVDTDFFLLENKRVLKKGGLIIVNTPNLGAWFNRILLLLGYQPFFTEVSTYDKTLGLKFTRKITPIRKPLGHLRVFTLRALIDLLELHGFEIIIVKGFAVNYFPWQMSIIDRVFSNFPSLASDLVIVARKK